MLKTVGNEQRDDWDDHLEYMVSAYRHSRHESTGYSSFYMMYGRHAKMPLDIIVGLPPTVPHRCESEYVQ